MATANKNLSEYDKSTIPNAKNFRFGIVVSQWNSHITKGLYNGCVEALLDCGTQKNKIYKFEVPGSFELIYGAKKLLESNTKYDAIIVIGSVIKGETMHFDFVCQGVTNGIAQLNASEKYDIPVIFCVLTDNTEQQSIDRSGGKLGNKGTEAAITALKMVDLQNY